MLEIVSHAAAFGSGVALTLAVLIWMDISVPPKDHNDDDWYNHL